MTDAHDIPEDDSADKTLRCRATRPSQLVLPHDPTPAATVAVPKKGPAMIRKVVNLVRHKTFTEMIEAVVESPRELDPTNLEDLWSCLLGHRIEPDVADDTDWGIQAFSCDYDPGKHAHLPVVNLHALADFDPLPRLPSVNGSKHPRKRRLTVRSWVLLTRDSEQYQVKQMVVQASTTAEIETADATDLWWCTPHVPVEPDEYLLDEFAIETAPYCARGHTGIPFVYLDRLPSPAKLSAPNRILSGWEPSLCPAKKDVAESQRTAELIRARPQECYFNARAVLRSLPDYSDAAYVEGFIVADCSIPIEHGWIVRNGTIVDPTLPTDAVAYFPGLEFRGRQEVRDFLQTEHGRTSNSHPFHLAFGLNGFMSQSFRSAFDQATTHLTKTL